MPYELNAFLLNGQNYSTMWLEYGRFSVVGSWEMGRIRSLKIPFPMLQCGEQSEELRSALDNAISESPKANDCLQGVNLSLQL